MSFEKMENLREYGEYLQKLLYGMVDHDPNHLGLGFSLPVDKWTPEKIATLESLLGIQKNARHS